MVVIGLDDTDSRERGMCTTYLATLVAEAVETAGGTVDDRLLVRLNPAIEHKTRGNAALAIVTDLDADTAFELAREQLVAFAETDDPRTSPGLVVAPGTPEAVPCAVAEFTRRSVRERHTIDAAVELLDAVGYRHEGWKEGRGRIGALAAIGADAAFDDWTYEYISYREFARCGTPRDVDWESVFDAATDGYPTVWDTVDREEGQAVCVPRAPGPILHGIRGDDPNAVRRVAGAVDGESVDRSALFRTNQGTDVHLRPGTVADVVDGRAYRLDGTVGSPPETYPGGHVFFELDGGGERVDCVAFEPTKRFRDRVRALRVGDRLTVCGEVSDGSVKLEKFAVRELVRTERVVPECSGCGRSMKSAGRGQGYRCRECGTRADGKVTVPVERALEPGWYEVPPCARRHIAKPLIRGGFDAPVHAER